MLGEYAAACDAPRARLQRNAAGQIVRAIEREFQRFAAQIDAQFIVDGYVDEQALFAIDRVLEIEEWIV